MRLLAAILLLIMPLPAQRAQLARKGRKTEAGKRAAATPIRQLPRAQAPTPPAVVRLPIRKFPAARPLPEDRVRPLLKGAVTPLRTAYAAELHHQVRFAIPALAVRVADLHGVEPTPIVNRWKIFPAPPW